jgi:pyruvate,orthophosphate dikinase
LAYSFDVPPDGDEATRLEMLGGKGKSLADMKSRLGLPVPPGFTITTAACREYLAHGWSDALDRDLDAHLEILEKSIGRRLGGADTPLLVSVRSGSAVSMPGMMDTVLNVGMNDDTEASLGRATGDVAFARDCRERLHQTFAKAVSDGELPADPRAQIRASIEAVFLSWNSARARAYRRIENISDDAGTAVTVQAMVFGNLDDMSGTGVVFSRDPSTGHPALFGDVLFRAQGEDVVSGSQHTLNIKELAARYPAIGQQLETFVRRIERHYRDLVEVEFTIEAGTLWILQARTGKRSPHAVARIAHDMANDPSFPLTRVDAVHRVEGVIGQLNRRKAKTEGAASLGMGLGASPGLASGRIAVSSEDAIEMASRGIDTVLVRPETSPSDVEGISAAVGLLTAKGGLASHAAVVARGWGKPAVVGLEQLEIASDHILIAGQRIDKGATITIDGETGEVFEGHLESDDSVPPEVAEVMRWKDEPIAATAVPTARRVPSRDELLVLLANKGLAMADAIPDILGLEAPAAAEVLDGLGGHLDRSNARFLKLTASGAEEAASVIAGHRARAGDNELVEALTSFREINAEFKSLVTEWQMRASPGTDETTVKATERRILAQLQNLHTRLCAWLASTAAAGATQLYVDRFHRAAGRLANGETSYLVSPRVDSYHNVWFELHEFLIRLAGRTRQEEEAHG